jgi:hypothetical protein
MRIRTGLAAAAALTAATGLASAQEEVRYDDYPLLEVDIAAMAQIDMLETLGSTILDCVHRPGPTRCVAPPHVLFELDVSGITYEVLHPNVQELIDAETRRITAFGGGIAGADLCDPSWFDDYHPLDEINARMDLIAAEHPDLVEKFQFGTTVEGRPMFAMRMTAPGGDPKPAILYNACQHAREWVAPTLPMYIATQLACGWESGDPEITAVLETIEFIIIPIVNPDGYLYSWPPGERLWRKNRRDNGDGTFGVDLNRNWEVGWGGEGADDNPGDTLYHGPKPFSEPETQALRDLFLANPHIAATIDFHSFGQLVLWPWGFTFDPLEDGGVHNAMGLDMEAAIESVNGFSYVQGQLSPVLYQASGVSVDWTYGAANAFSFTVELRDQGQNGFVLPPDQILPTCQENFAGAMVLADWVMQGVAITFPGGLPGIVQSDEPATISTYATSISAGDIVGASLFVRIGAGPEFTDMPMSDLGDGLFEGTLPAAPCGSTIDYYIEIEVESGLTYNSPEGAPVEFYAVDALDITTFFQDDFETDQGWTVVDDGGLTEGTWERGVPVGGGDRGDPPFDADGSGQCYLTENEDGNSDVDDGTTTLTSPTLDASDPDARIQYYRWFSNDQGGEPGVDVMVIEISGDGGSSWTLLEEVNENANAWVFQSFLVADFVTPGDQVQVRFTAGDLGDGSIVEAGVDGVRVVKAACDGDPGVPGDVNGDGSVDVEDLIEIITNWGPCPGCPADLTGDGVVNVEDLVEVITNWG